MNRPAGPELLARGPWTAEQIRVSWIDEHFRPAPEHEAEADERIAALRDRGSPSHDGLAVRLDAFSATGDGALELALQPLRWALRLVEGDASASMAALCVTRAADGRWLAGRRSPWVASWAGRWALGAGGAVDIGESPFETLSRELREEWSVEAERVQAEMLVRLPNGAVMFVGQAWLPEGAEITMDHEHDEHAWWPADVDAWPDEADAPLRLMARMVG
ncbi:MAG: NUDIX domain-containing protein [Baekduia sp.]